MCMISLQEEERERRMDFVPEESAVNTDLIEVHTCLQTLLDNVRILDVKEDLRQWAPTGDLTISFCHHMQLISVLLSGS